MSHLSFLEKLLDGAEVAWLPLGDESLGEFVRGGSLQKKDFTKTGIGCIHYGQIYTHYRTFTYETKSFVSKEFAKKARKAKTGDLVIATTSENDEDVCKAVAWLGSDDIAVSNHTCIYKHNLNPKYVSYFFQTESFQSQKRPYITGIKVRCINTNNLAKIIIPIPCPTNPKKSLAIQTEIVRILDKFTALNIELTTGLIAELNMRKKQYHYYRDQLLAVNQGDVKWKSLGDISKYSKSRISYDRLDETNYVGVDNLLQNRAGKKESNRIPTSGNLTRYCKGDILIGNIRPYLKKIWHADCTGGTNGDVLVIQITDKTVNPRYLYQVLADDKFFEYNMRHAQGAKMPRGNKAKIMEYSVPTPKSEAEQAHIANILDKFDVLINSVSESLPREIELRNKQYEYYRDLLLSFPKPDETAK